MPKVYRSSCERPFIISCGFADCADRAQEQSHDQEGLAASAEDTLSDHGWLDPALPAGHPCLRLHGQKARRGKALLRLLDRWRKQIPAHLLREGECFPFTKGGRRDRGGRIRFLKASRFLHRPELRGGLFAVPGFCFEKNFSFFQNMS